MSMQRLVRNFAGAALVALAACAPAYGYDDPVEKKTFTLPSYTTVGGRTIASVRVGYETYGKMLLGNETSITPMI